jgi:hypothetical protein
MADIINLPQRTRHRQDTNTDNEALEATTNNPVYFNKKYSYRDIQVTENESSTGHAYIFYWDIFSKVAPTTDAWEQIERELLDQKWDFRTVDGLSNRTGLSEQTVRELLESHKSEIRIAYFTDQLGRLLFTHSSRPVRWRELLTKARAFITKSPAI